MLVLRSLIVLPVCFIAVNGADILILSMIASTSHSLWFGKLYSLLAKNGHSIVVLDTDKNFFEHPNVTHIVMEGSYGWLKEVEQHVEENPDGLDDFAENKSVFETILMISNSSFVGCDTLLQSPATKKFMEDYKGKKFDLIIADSFCEVFYGFVHIFGNPPLVPATPYLEQFYADSIGLYDNPSYVPFHGSNLTPTMDFFQRLTNTIYYTMAYFIFRHIAIPNSDVIIKDVFGSSAPGVASILHNNVPLVMSGYSHVIQGAKPLPPNYISIPGFHATPPEPLPKDIKKFLDGAKDGAILFSMGSNFKSVLMSPEKREMFLSVFRNIPQRVVWKLELENDTSIPSNVMVKKWLPQNDILGHPNIKAFISHGGLLGTHEAVYHGVPMLGLPLMFDQAHNMEKLEKHGVAIRLYYKKLNRQYIANQIDKIINDPSYLCNMKELSAVFRDTPETSQQRALFWIEYVLRNSNNKKNYLKSASVDLEWYQRLLLDQVFFLLACLISVIMIFKVVLKRILNLLCGSKSKNESSMIRKKKQ